MEKNILSTIKYDSVREILESKARHEKISRAEIAAETGLSLMTVGKVADALLELDIVVQSKETRLRRCNSAKRYAAYRAYALLRRR